MDTQPTPAWFRTGARADGHCDGGRHHRLGVHDHHDGRHRQVVDEGLPPLVREDVKVSAHSSVHTHTHTHTHIYIYIYMYIYI